MKAYGAKVFFLAVCVRVLCRLRHTAILPALPRSCLGAAWDPRELCIARLVVLISRLKVYLPSA